MKEYKLLAITNMLFVASIVALCVVGSMIADGYNNRTKIYEERELARLKFEMTVSVNEECGKGAEINAYTGLFNCN